MEPSLGVLYGLKMTRDLRLQRGERNFSFTDDLRSQDCHTKSYLIQRPKVTFIIFRPNFIFRSTQIMAHAPQDLSLNSSNHDYV